MRTYIKMQGNSVSEGLSHLFGVVADISTESSMIPFSVFFPLLAAANDNICEMDVFWCMADGNPIEACNLFINFQKRVVVARGPPMTTRDISAFDGDWPLANVHGGIIRELCPIVFAAQPTGTASTDGDGTDFDMFKILGLFEDDPDVPFFLDGGQDDDKNGEGGPLGEGAN